MFGCAGSSWLYRFFSSCSAWASHCGGFSCCGAWALGLVGFSSTQASFPQWHVRSSVSGTESLSPVLAGRFFITEPPGKPYKGTFH